MVKNIFQITQKSKKQNSKICKIKFLNTSSLYHETNFDIL